MTVQVSAIPSSRRPFQSSVLMRSSAIVITYKATTAQQYVIYLGMCCSKKLLAFQRRNTAFNSRSINTIMTDTGHGTIPTAVLLLLLLSALVALPYYVLVPGHVVT